MNNKLMSGVALHEMIHVLGFSSDMFTSFVDGDGVVRTNVIASATSDQRSLAMLATPKVTEFVRNHFGCPTLAGAVLEDQGGAGTAGSHWEKASFMDEIMTGAAPAVPVLSGLTLGMLADSGWYLVDETKAQWLAWGEGKGCKFVLNRCNSGWPATDGYFCTSSGAVGCNYNHMASGSCVIRTYSSVSPTYFQYFTNTLLGGPVEIADFCPFVQAYSDGWCIRSSSSKADEYGQMLGDSSRCFESTLYAGAATLSDTPVPRCFPTFCASKTSLKVRIGDYWYACNGTANITNVDGFVGKLKCPNAALICGGSATSTTFPAFHRIEPTEASPGATVTIYGENFANGTTVDISGECEDPVVDASAGTITCTLASSASIKNLLGLTVDVIITQNGYSLLTPNAFVVSTDWAAWASRNAFLLFAILLSILVLGFMFCVIGLKVHDRHKADKEWKNRRRQEQFDNGDF